MAKTPEEVTLLIKALEEAYFEVKSYSGRGMFGKYCVSVSDGSSAWDIAKGLWRNDFGSELDYCDIPEPRQDSLGLGIVLYWPSYTWPEDKE
jgi:hypothetical protein